MIVGAIAGAIIVVLVVWFQSHRTSFKWAAIIAGCSLSGVLIMEALDATIGFGPKTYQGCIFTRMPGVANDVAAVSVVRQCQAEYFYLPPDWQAPTSQKAHQCIAARANNTPSQKAAGAIGVACRIEYPN